MKLKFLLIINLAIAFKLFSQIPDSLIGIYEGELWVKEGMNGAWNITPATELVHSLDTFECTTILSGALTSMQGLTTTFWTDYPFCNDPYNPPNEPTGYAYPKFYEKDSLRVKLVIPQPYPNIARLFYYFFGKRTPGSNGLVGVHENMPEAGFTVFPNPFSDEVIIEAGNSVLLGVIIYSITGKQVYQNAGKIPDRINLSFLENGLYVIGIETDKGVAFKKLTKIN